MLKFRAAHLLTENTAARLVAVTFTKEAAKSLSDSIKDHFPEGAARVTAGTFHSLCKQQIEQGKRRVTLLKDGQRMRMLIESMRAVAGKDACTLDELTEAIDAFQSNVDAGLPPVGQNSRADIFRRYEQLKAHHGVLDYADLIRNAVRGMRDGTIAPLRVGYMLVDEFQDTDKLQMAWVMEHVNHGAQVTIVGDDDQSIYGWRGGLGYGGMMAFKDLTKAAQINLDRTYRCAVDILKPAARLIVHNRARVDKQLATANTSQGFIAVRSFQDRESEVDGCIDAIARSGVAEAWGVLARTNAQLDRLEASIVGEFTFKRSGGSSFWELKGPSLLLEVVGSLASGKMLGVEAMLVAVGISPNYMDRIRTSMRTEGTGALGRFISHRLPAKGPVDDRTLALLARDMVGEWHGLVTSGDPDDIAPALNGVAHFLSKHTVVRGQSEEARKHNHAMLAMAARSLGQMQGSIAMRLNAVRRAADQRKQDGGGARLMTLHGAKGLEFDRVWILGCEQGVLPSSQSDMEEERRLMYVGMTRAKTHLTLSYALDREPSQFLSEAGLHRGGVLSSESDGVTVAAN